MLNVQCYMSAVAKRRKMRKGDEGRRLKDESQTNSSFILHPSSFIADRRPIVISALLVLAIIAIYAQCIHHPFLRLDDPDYVLENDHVNSGLSLSNIAWAFTALYASNWQ